MPSRTPRLSIAQLATIFVFSVVAIPAVAGVVLKSRPTEEATMALSRIKQATIATMMYCADFDDLFPYAQSTETAKSVLMPYAKNREIFQSPTKGGKFVYNVNIGGVNQVDIPAPAEAPVWVEQLLDASDPAVGYADGHAKLITPDKRKKLAAALKQKFPRKKNSKPLPKNHRGY